ncbi:MAG: nucleotidyltransferase family protein [Myxococcota bacterium]
MTDRPIFGAVLCAGFGTRLRPLTNRLPKPLIPFLNTPIVTYALDHLSRVGAEKVGINLHHLPDAIPPVVDKICERFGLGVTYSREWEILGTAGGIRGMWKALGEPDCTLVVLNGDSIMNIDLAEHVAAHREAGAAATLVVRPRADGQPGRVWLDDDGALMGLRDMRHPDAGEGLTEYDFTGVHILEPGLLADIPLEEGCMVGDIYGPMLEDGVSFNTSVNDDFWAALDNPDLFLETTRRVLDDPGLFEQAPFPQGCEDGRYLYSDASLDEDAQLESPSFVGMQAELMAESSAGPYAVVDGATLGPHSTVRNAVVYGMGDIEGAWEDCIAVAGEVAHTSEHDD